MPEKFFIIDAYALIFRSYYAFIRTPMRNSEGFNTSVLHGFLSTILDILKRETPSHLVVIFDDDKPSFRKTEYSEYKAQRQKTPEDIKASVPILKKILNAMDINYLQLENFEADDVIASIAKRNAKDSLQVFIVTSDKDFYQVLDKNIFMYKPRSRAQGYDIITADDILKRFGFRSVKNFIDILALWGDSSDNIPGAKGIGEKGALQLVTEFGSVEEIYANIKHIPVKFQKKLIESKENVFLSKKLATIITDINLNNDIELFRIKKFSTEKVFPILQKYALRNIMSKIGGDFRNKTETVSKQQNEQLSFFDTTPKTLTNNNHHHIINTEDSLQQILTQIRQSKQVFFQFIYSDTVNRFNANTLAVALTTNAKEIYFIQLTQNKIITNNIFDIFTDQSILKIGYHIKNDIFILNNHKQHFTYPFFDIFLAHYLINPDERHNFEFLSLKYLDYQPIDTTKYWNKQGQKLFEKNNLPVDFACERVELIYRLYHKLSAEIEKNRLQSLLHNIELPLVEVLAVMEFNGVYLNLDILKNIENKLKIQLKEIEEKIYSLAGETFNIASAKQLGIILFEKIGINPGKKHKLTKTKQYSTNEETLLKLVKTHEIVPSILSYRKLSKLLNTYVEALPKLINQRTGKIHTTYNQAVTNTGRLSSINPNLQNIPVKDNLGREIRASFTPEMPSGWFVSADYSQIELRILAEYSKDPHLLEAFAKNMDIHTATACKINKVKPEEVSNTMRQKAKVANFGIIYGISAFGLAERLQIPRSEAKELIENYFKNFPTIKKYIENTIEKARTKGYAETLFGRRKYLPDINSRNHVVRNFAERNAINMPIQGTAADIIKMAMIQIHKEIRKQHLKTKMIMQVHDELCFEVPHNELGIVRQLISEKMENVHKFEVALKVEVGVGKNWMEAH